MDLSTRVGKNEGAVAGGVGTTATYNQKDNSKIWLIVTGGICIVLVVGILAWMGQLDKVPLIGETIAKLFGRM